MTAPEDKEKRCFTYCGDDICDCPARRAFTTLAWVSTALPVLSTMCEKVGLDAGKAKADEMASEVSEVIKEQPQ